jgi:hypothetical protein
MEAPAKQLIWRQLPMVLGHESNNDSNKYVTRIQLLSRNQRTDSQRRSGIEDSCIDIFHGVSSLTVAELRRELKQHQPFKIRWAFPSLDHQTNFYDAQAIAVHWQKVSQEMKDFSPLLSVSSLSLSMPSNRDCIPFAFDFFLNMSLPNSKILELSDNFSDPNQYSEIFQRIAHTMPKVEVLALRNTAVRESPMVSSTFCTALAHLIQSSCLSEIHIIGIEFPSVEDWIYVREVLRISVTITNISVSQLSIANTPFINDIKVDEKFFNREVDNEPKYTENRLCTQYLTNTLKLVTPFTMQQRLEALMHVRGHRRPDMLDPDNERSEMKLTEQLASVADRVDFCFEFMRHFVDPTVLVEVRHGSFLPA